MRSQKILSRAQPREPRRWGFSSILPQNRHPERSASQICRVKQHLCAESKDPGGAYLTHAARSFSTTEAREQDLLTGTSLCSYLSRNTVLVRGSTFPISIIIIELTKKEMSISELCRTSGVSRPTGYRWINRYKESGFPLCNDNRETAELFRMEFGGAPSSSPIIGTALQTPCAENRHRNG